MIIDTLFNDCQKNGVSVGKEKEIKSLCDGSFYKDEWMSRLKKAKTTEEFDTLIHELPVPKPRYKPTDSIEFTELQISELRNAARIMVESQCLGELPWADAWGGTFPREPTTDEVEAMFLTMKEDAIRILKFGFSDDDYSTTEKHCRMVHLESCKSLDLYGRK